MDAVANAITACAWSSSQFLVISANVFDPLIYYSHFTALFISLGFGTFVVLRNPKSLATRTLFIATLFLSVWVFGDLTLWATEYSSVTMFFWSMVNLAEPFVYAFMFYFVYVFILKKDMPFRMKLLIFLPLLITLALTPTKFALLGYDLSNCNRDAIEGPLVYYGYILELLYTMGIIVLAVVSYRRNKRRADRLQITLVTLGTVLFLLSFAFGNIIGTWFSNQSFLGDYSWTIGQYGLFGAPIFIGFLSYLIVRFRIFNIGLLASQALVLALVVVLGSEFAFVHTLTNIALVSVTLVLTGVIGIVLIRSVRREIELREHVEKLAKDLQIANENQVTLIHFITHQIKGFVTKSRNIFSMLLEGEYGVIPEGIKPMLEEGFKSDTKGAETIQEILNASNIKSGKVSYTMAPFDLKALIEEIANGLKATAEAKHLSLDLSLGNEPITINGDRAQLVNAFKNLIDNSIRYTPSGHIDVRLEKGSGKATVTVSDSGVGITAEDMKNLFTEGGHGKESTKVNVESTGFGLYIVKNIVEAHKGKVWAESEGAGKGSRFIVELPA